MDKEMKDEFKIDFLASYTRENIIEELKRISQIVGGRPLLKKDIERYGRVSYGTIRRRFGTLAKAVIAAGLSPNIYHHNIADEELLEALINLWSRTLREEGRRPEQEDLKKYGVPFSKYPYYRRFGSWRKALIVAYDSIGRPQTITEAQQDSVSPVTKPQRDYISDRKRFLVFKRDEFTCVICGRSGRGVRLQVDHKIPISKSGTDDFDNLQTLCFECNQGKRNDFESKHARE